MCITEVNYGLYFIPILHAKKQRRKIICIKANTQLQQALHTNFAHFIKRTQNQKKEEKKHGHEHKHEQ